MTAQPRITRVDVFPWNLAFKRPAKTSRDTLTHKPSWFIKLTDENGCEGWGECSIIPGLSLDDPAAIAAFFSKAQLIRRSGRRKSRFAPSGSICVRNGAERPAQRG